MSDARADLPPPPSPASQAMGLSPMLLGGRWGTTPSVPAPAPAPPPSGPLISSATQPVQTGSRVEQRPRPSAPAPAAAVTPTAPGPGPSSAARAEQAQIEERLKAPDLSDSERIALNQRWSDLQNQPGGPGARPSVPARQSTDSTPPAVGVGKPMFTYEQISQAATGYGLDPALVYRVVGIESDYGANTGNTKSPSNTGLFQMAPYNAPGGAGDTPQNQLTLGLRLLKQEKADLEQELGRPATNAEIYLAHQQGAHGAAQLIKNPNVPAGQVTKPINISNNEGDPNAPASAFVKHWEDRYAGTIAEGTGGTGGPSLRDNIYGGLSSQMQKLVDEWIAERPARIAAYEEEMRSARDLTAMRRAREKLLEAEEAHPPRNMHEAWSTWGGVAGLLALMGGFIGRGHATAALGAAGAMMEAANQADEHNYDRAYKEWQHHTEMMDKAIDRLRQDARDIVDDANKSWDHKNAELKTMSEIYQLPMTMSHQVLENIEAQQRIEQANRKAIEDRDIERAARAIVARDPRYANTPWEQVPADVQNQAMGDAKFERAGKPGAAQYFIDDTGTMFKEQGGQTLTLDNQPYTPVGTPRRVTGAVAPFGNINDLMKRWHDDFVRPVAEGGQGREPTTDEIAKKRAELIKQARPQSATSQNIVRRLQIGANEVSKAVEAMTALPGGTTLGIFGGAQAALGPDLGENVKKALANKITPEASQVLKTFTNGVTRGLAILEAAGASTGLVGLAALLAADLPEANDTGFNIAAKYAYIRQIVEAATEVLQADPLLDEKQQELMARINKRVTDAVPFTTVDVARLVGGPSHETLSDFGRKLGLGGPAKGAAAPTAATPATALPEGVPPGSKLIGTVKGHPVYEAPDGSRYNVTP